MIQNINLLHFKISAPDHEYTLHYNSGGDFFVECRTSITSLDVNNIILYELTECILNCT
jgi:hypothetical protein